MRLWRSGNSERFQSTLPRRERRFNIAQWSVSAQFQSTLPRRERPVFTLFSQPCKLFQSTLPRRERLTAFCAAVTSSFISIHAPAKGATAGGRNHRKRVCDFNPRSREGSDGDPAMARAGANAFQSTLPRRERRFYWFVYIHSGNFNPRSREGSDHRQQLPML